MMAEPILRGGSDWVSTEEVAQLLGVKKNTVYAYVSRGLLTAHRYGRTSRFKLDEVRALVEERNPDGVSLLGSHAAVFSLEDDQIFYRGQEALSLLETHTFEGVAELLWDWKPSGPKPHWVLPDDDTVRLTAEYLAQLPEEALVIDRLKLAIATLAALDHPGPSYFTPEVVESSKRHLVAMVNVLPPVATPPSAGQRLASILWSRLSPLVAGPEETDLLDSALILTADHGLAGSTRVVRTAAALGATVRGVLSVGMDVGTNDIKGSSALIVEDMVRGLGQSRHSLRSLVETARLQRGLPGFGHDAHPNGDMRARWILDQLKGVTERSPRYRVVEQLTQVMSERGLPPPNIYLALAAVAYCYDMARGATEVMFAVGRSAGWVAHALEEYKRRGFAPPKLPPTD